MKALFRPLLIVCGSLFVILGIVGIVFPLIPTTPFLLLAAFCYAKSSENLYNKLLNTKWLGAYIRSFQEGKGIPLRAKFVSIMVLWFSSGYSIFFLVPLLAVKIILLGIVVYITYYIWSIPTKVMEKEISK
ncbi:YbaN family protein [Neobacillus sp. D3-1R]|uniref:YbaN family protein n=1 Tax=Neobacillus sp. D3-1R TaxID=3445778 RepID=UPI003F9F85C3